MLLSNALKTTRLRLLCHSTQRHTLRQMSNSNHNEVARSTRWPVDDQVPDLTGKVALVTGANSSGGMGFHIAYQMASKNAKVYIGARNTSKAQSAIQEMKTENPNIGDHQLVPFVADLGDLRAVQISAQALLDAEHKLDILVHNAAVISMPLEMNSDGVSVSFATNHLGPFVLTNTVMPLLENATKSTGDSRVVMVSAASFKLLPPGIRFNSLESFNAEMEPTVLGGADFTRYSLSKLANILFAKQLQKTFDATNTKGIALALHPGLIKTDGVVNSLQPGKARTLDGRLTPAEGALTALFAATNPVVVAQRENYKGAYLVPPGSIEALTGDANDDDLAQELWTTSEQVVKAILG
ncbi:short-chain dehydrogenase [Xylariaceae sp. FL1019]|nr:short-chain dehydrogenase [Xylariaceae sp. FL1019]